ncbi:MAG: DUF4276 family protein [Polyangiales bacterium]
MSRRVACIVEGHGELESVPLLLRRIHAESPGLLQPDLKQSDVIRTPRSKLLRAGELERAVELAARRTGSEGAVLVLVDSNDKKPCVLGPKLLSRAKTARSDVRLSVVLAKKEYEAWFLAGARSLAGKAGFAPDLTPPPDPESIRDAKGWLAARRTGKYREVIDQPRLTALLSLEEARAAPSFDKLWRDVHELLAP